jgi:hypothetical protein
MNKDENYVLRKHKLNGRWNFDVEQENLIYSDCAPTHHGLQCNHIGGTEKHTQILELCSQMVEIIKKIDELNTLPERVSLDEAIRLANQTPQDEL